MRPLSSRLLAVTAALASVLTAAVALDTPANAEGTGQIRITEFEYNGSEFVEFTNVTGSSINMSGWTFSDSARATSGGSSTSLSSVGTLVAGESFLLTEDTAANFRSAWGSNVCAAVKIVGSNGVNLGNGDEINIYNSGTLVDRLTYANNAAPKTDTTSARPPSSGVLGANNHPSWVFSTVGDADGAWSNGARLGSPGRTQFGSYNECGGGGGSVTLTSAYPGLAAAIGDSTNPTLPVTLSPTTATLSVISSSNSSVASTGGISFSGSGANRTVTVTPGSTEGYSDIVIRATDGSSTANLTFRYGLTRNQNDASQRWYSGAGNASTAIDAGDDYAWVGDDEQQVLHLYNLEQSGPAVKTFDIAAQFATSFSEEIDLEASARIGNTIYWMGSMSNKNGGDESPPRNTLFATTISGTGASSTLTKTGVINTRLRQNLRALGTSGSDPYGLYAGFTAGENGHDPSMANLEGMELAPDGTTVYLGFRGPIKSGEALIVPWTNPAAMTTSASTNATFGTPFWLDLDGYGIRDIRKNAANEYLISAGLTTASGGGYINAGFRLYSWNGQPGTAPVDTGVAVPQMPVGATADSVGAWEGIAEMPASLNGATVRMIQDNGDATPYGVANGSTKDDSGGWLYTRPELQKDLSLRFTLPASELNPTPTPTISGSAVVGQTLTAVPGIWGPTPVTLTYEWKTGSTVLGTGTTLPLTAANLGQSITVSVTGTKAGFPDITKTSSAVTVTAAALSPAPVPTINGTPVVDGVLTAVPGTWGPAPVALAYEWKTGSTVLGTDETLPLTASNLGQQVTVSVTGTKAGYTTLTQTSAPVTVAPATLASTPIPTIDGTAAVGHTLNTVSGTWDAGVVLSYEWKSGSTVLSAGTMLPLTAEHLGQEITVSVTGTKEGYTTVTRTSAPVTVVDLTAPVLIAPGATTIDFGAEFDSLEGVSAADDVDGDLTSEIEVDASELNLSLPGSYSVHYEVSDSAGNTSTATQVVTVDKGLAVLSVADVEVGYGESATAIVEIDGGPLTVAGSVQISEGEDELGSGPVVGGTAEIDLGVLEPGEHTLTASYSGSAQLQTAETTFTVTVEAAGPPQDLTVWVDPRYQGLMGAIAQEIDGLHVAQPSSDAPGAPYAIEGCEGEIPRPFGGSDYLLALLGAQYADATGQVAPAPSPGCGPTVVTVGGDALMFDEGEES